VLKIYNTLTGKKEAFRSIASGKAGVYVCGVTVYDRCHLGHARSAIVFDVVRRYLTHKGYQVLYVRNFTDVDDKIINRSLEESRSWNTVAETYIQYFQEDMKRLGVLPANLEPKATDHIRGMVDHIGKLVKKGYAYVIDGNVYYRVKRFRSYGRLSKRNPEELLSGARVEVDKRKEDSLDFALWKASKPGEPAWESPWGLGRPGWHIECSVMSMSMLGATFDIHGGGKDLIFPHHENEIAQSEAATGKRFVRYWMHNGFVTVDQEKMSKSLGNFFTIQQIFEKSPWPQDVTAEALRYLLLSTHYRSPINWSDTAFHAAKGGLDNFYDLFIRLKEIHRAKAQSDKEAMTVLKRFLAKFKNVMDDDFNTAVAIAEFQKLRATMNRMFEKGISKGMAERIRSTYKKIGSVLGLFQVDPESWKMGKNTVVPLNDNTKVSDVAALSTALQLSQTEIQRLVREREEARRRKDWRLADILRRQLGEAGVIIEDRPDGTTRVKR
jgi:cysteinyl-tRNA synthetase